MTTKKTSPCPLRLPVPRKVAAERLSKQGGMSINRFVLVAVAAEAAAAAPEDCQAAKAPASGL